MPRGLSRGHHRGKHSLAPTRSASFHTVSPSRMALLTAPLVTALGVGAGVATSGFSPPDRPPARPAAGAAAISAAGSTRSTPATRRARHRTRVRPSACPWSTTGCPSPRAGSGPPPTSTCASSRARRPDHRSAQVRRARAVTGRKTATTPRSSSRPAARWVTADYLSKKKTPRGRWASATLPAPTAPSIESAIQPRP